jgi:hypothetical protein
MKRLAYVLIILSLFLFACSLSGIGFPTAIPLPTLYVVPTMDTATPVDTVTPVIDTATPVPPTETPTEPVGYLKCNELSLILDPALASGYDCQTIPEVSGADIPAWGVNPQYTEVTFIGYVLSDRFFTPRIDVFPVQRFSELFPQTIDQRVVALQALVAGGAPADPTLPILPVFNAAQEFYAQYQVLSFAGGGGIRYLTQYSQFADPVNNNEMFYSFQGLTSDGKYWISAVLPSSNPLLPINGDNPPDGQDWSQFETNFTSYIGMMTTTLNSQTPDSFSPSLSALDALVSTIKVQP